MVRYFYIHYDQELWIHYNVSFWPLGWVQFTLALGAQCSFLTFCPAKRGLTELLCNFVDDTPYFPEFSAWMLPVTPLLWRHAVALIYFELLKNLYSTVLFSFVWFPIGLLPTSSLFLVWPVSLITFGCDENLCSP